MAVALKALFDKRRLALTRARLRAWWAGDEFNEEAAIQTIEAELAAAAANDADPFDALFDEPPYEAPARLVALNKLWGAGRLRPGDDTADALEPARIGIAPDGLLGLWGPGLAGPVVAVATKHPGKIEVSEWREESLDMLKHGVVKAKLDERVTVARVDLDAHVWPLAHFDGILSIDDFAYCGYPPHLAQQIMKSLKPGACAVVESYVGLPSSELATAFASSFAEPQIRAHGDVLQWFKDVGLAIEADEDLTEEFLDHARTGFLSLGKILSDPEALDVAAARELAWEAEAWRTRLRLLSQRRLERRRFTLRKPTDAAAVVPQVPTAPAAS